jgi:cell division protein FtsW
MMKGFVVIALVASLIFLGLAMIVDIGSTEWIEEGQSTLFFKIVLKQFFSLCLGAFCAFLISRVFGPKLDKMAPFLFFATLIMLVLVFVPGIGVQVKGARRWLNMGFFHLQPSEILKFTLPLYFVKKNESMLMDKSFGGFIKSQFIFIIPIFLVIMEPDNGTAALLLVTMAAIYFLLQIKLRYYLIPMGLVLLTAIFLGSRMTHVKERLDIFLHPEKDLFGKGHQPYQAKIAAASGGIFGLGLGQSLQKLNFLPEARSDYIAAIYSEEFGFVGILVLSCIYVSLFCCCFCISLSCPDRFTSALVMLYTFLIAMGTFINLGVVCGLLPSKGANLPFFSQGGSSLIVHMSMIAYIVCQSINNEERVCASASV